LKIQEELENYADLRSLREAKKLEREAPTIDSRNSKELF